MADTADDLSPLLQFLERSRGFDSSGYKRPSLQRRLGRRMAAVGLDAYADYVDYLEVHPDEFAELFDTIRINVTSFFRDAPAWRHLDEHVLPRLLAAAGDRELRIWSAGCASGEEAYSISMLLVRHLGEEAFRERVKVYATDVDDDALNIARLAQYDEKAVQAIPEELLDRCFTRVAQQFAFRKELRRSVIFGRNDLVQDAPISRIDVLLCRNVRIYFTADAQERMLRRFSFALNDSGALFLGKSELLLTHGDRFRPVDLKSRIFAKVPRGTVRDRLAFVADGATKPVGDAPYGRVRDGAFDLAPVAQLVIDRDGVLVVGNQAARTLFGLQRADFGRPLQDLELSYRPVELRSPIEQAARERRAISLGIVLWLRPGAQERHLDVHVVPVLSETDDVLGTSVSFDDVGHHVQLRDQLERSKRELEVAYEDLRSTVTELERTNEELQSTNEELETINSELRDR